MIGVHHISAAVGQAPKNAETPKPLFKATAIRLKSFLFVFSFLQCLLSLLVAENQTIAGMKTIQEQVEFSSLLYIRVKQSLQKSICRSISKLDGSTPGHQSNVPTVVPVYIRYMLAVAFHCRLPQSQD
jgi:hypothetical protein